ncbi:MAG: poly-gamma-glutamate synthase PgsB [Bacteroidales bacterium]|nr:poly-gamma-glutamate synthase PgsB [Bacteroidales bacterium]
MLITVVLLGLVLFLMISESLIIRNCTRHISVKIHVNGTRGKSTITKYVFAGLQENGLKVMGKVTGEIPTLLLPDGTSKTIKRRGSARVQEQFNTIRRAYRRKADALVLECMSIDPVLQKLEGFIFRPHIYIISNIRDDHREKMGATLDDQINAICSAIPPNCKVIACGSSYMDIIKKVASERKSLFVEATILEDEEKKRIPEYIHEINVRFALTACIESGIPRETAFNGILKQVDKEVLPISSIIQNNHQQYFLNAFSVNDIPSVKDYLKYWTNELKITDKMSVVFNTRSDRPLRTDLFIEWIKSNQENIDTVFLAGDHTMRAYRLLSRSDKRIKIKKIHTRSHMRIKDIILENAADSGLIVGIGNIKGLGYRIINEFSEAS